MPPTHLLLVHRDPLARAVLASMLDLPRLLVDEAEDERAAARRLLAGPPPGLVLLGVDAADPDALELPAYVRRHCPGVPILLMATTSPEEFSTRALDLGVAAVLSAPVSPEALRVAVARALEASRVLPASPPEGPPPPKGPMADFLAPARGPDSRPEGAVLPEVPGDPPATRWAGPDRPGRRPPSSIRPLKESLAEYEREIILEALEQFGWCRSRTAEALGLDRTNLYKRMTRLGLLDRGWR